ncbi:MAG: hypothetical protein QF864_17255 [SAR202 cluster bacterium]|nr:hypothetical protein [SAR202 cluster bacterium]
MKRLSLYLFLILLTLPTPSQADDINDLEIDGVSIGDSLLDHYSVSEIKKQLAKTVSHYKSKRIKRIYFQAKKNSTYRQYNFHYINDPSYRIVAVQGHNLYENNIDGCYEKQIEVTKDLENNFSILSKKEGNFNHKADKTGKSKIKSVRLELENGHIRIVCTSWSKKIKDNNPWKDTLKIIIGSNEYANWLRYEAY